MISLALALTLTAPQAEAPVPPPPAAVPVDPARLPVARRIAERLLPPGTMALMMKASMDMVANSVTDRMYDLPLRDFAKMGGLGEAQLKTLGPLTLKQMMEVIDPHFAERQRITMRVMGTEIGAFMATMEPEYRAGLADSLARRFDERQLAEIDRFFATPTGSAYAAQSMLLYVDPAMMTRMQSMMPRLMEAMPAIMAKIMAATDSLPKPRSYDSLTPAEKDKLKALIDPVTQ